LGTGYFSQGIRNWGRVHISFAGLGLQLEPFVNVLVQSARETFEKCPHAVIPAQAGIQKTLKILDSRFHGNDN
jgi:hypothetical protein